MFILMLQLVFPATEKVFGWNNVLIFQVSVLLSAADAAPSVYKFIRASHSLFRPWVSQFFIHCIHKISEFFFFLSHDDVREHFNLIY